MREPRMKGATIRELFEWYESRYGVENVRRIVARIQEDDLRALVDPDQPHVKLLPSSWYPARLVHTLLDAIVEESGEAEVRRIARDGARAFANGKLRGVYRFVLAKVVTPEMYSAMIQRMWRFIHDTGDRRFDIEGPGEAVSVVSNWAGHHRVLCLVTIETMCALLESMGKKDVRHERLSCVSDGATECVTRVTWQD